MAALMAQVRLHRKQESQDKERQGGMERQIGKIRQTLWCSKKGCLAVPGCRKANSYSHQVLTTDIGTYQALELESRVLATILLEAISLMPSLVYASFPFMYTENKDTSLPDALRLFIPVVCANGFQHFDLFCEQALMCKLVVEKPLLYTSECICFRIFRHVEQERETHSNFKFSFQEVTMPQE